LRRLHPCDAVDAHRRARGGGRRAATVEIEDVVGARAGGRELHAAVTVEVGDRRRTAVADRRAQQRGAEHLATEAVVDLRDAAEHDRDLGDAIERRAIVGAGLRERAEVGDGGEAVLPGQRLDVHPAPRERLPRIERAAGDELGRAVAIDIGDDRQVAGADRIDGAGDRFVDRRAGLAIVDSAVEQDLCLSVVVEVMDRRARPVAQRVGELRRRLPQDLPLPLRGERPRDEPALDARGHDLRRRRAGEIGDRHRRRCDDGWTRDRRLLRARAAVDHADDAEVVRRVRALAGLRAAVGEVVRGEHDRRRRELAALIERADHR
jgi:hypothetical protein